MEDWDVTGISKQPDMATVVGKARSALRRNQAFLEITITLVRALVSQRGFQPAHRQTPAADTVWEGKSSRKALWIRKSVAAELQIQML